MGASAGPPLWCRAVLRQETQGRHDDAASASSSSRCSCEGVVGCPKNNTSVRERPRRGGGNEGELQAAAPGTSRGRAGRGATQHGGRRDGDTTQKAVERESSASIQRLLALIP